MNYSQWLNNWRYFRLLCDRFEKSIPYVDDAIDQNGKLINGNTFSNEFCDLLLSTSAEFENVAKQLCKEIDSSFNETWSGMKDYTKIIIGKFPKIGKTKISTPIQSFYPLENWRMDNNDVSGVDWWNAQNNIKHQRYANITQSTFQNCYDALASLFVLELYAVTFVQGDEPIFEISINPCSYFSSKYFFNLIWHSPDDLPDFERE